MKNDFPPGDRRGRNAFPLPTRALKMRDQFRPETVDKALSKVDAQCDKLARISVDDPKRADNERLLDVLIENAQLAMTAHMLALDEALNAPLGN